MAFTTCQIASSSAALKSTPTCWDVFLSFQGADTRHNFTSHLYAALDRHGVRTFKDDHQLRSGDVISHALLQAIHESSTYIVVLSENYASSCWCLDELVEILDCYHTMQRLVIPVFYNIDPSIVRYQNGNYKVAFEKHGFRLADEMDKLDKWRLALTEVSCISGNHVSGNRSEADIIDNIVNEVLLKIDLKTLDVAKYPVGLDSRVKFIKNLLSTGTTGFIKFGIYGMGGVGKTTLAKALYNHLLENFQGSCFLANIKEVLGTEKGLISLQQQLIDDVLGSKNMLKVHNVDQGTRLIRDRICSSKVLIIIDDLDHHKQFESLVGQFASGSVVIITTRDEEILDTINVEPRYRYMLKELNPAESLALFTQHAFGNSKTNTNTLMALSKDVLHHAGGLPLALEVFGSYLYKRTEVGWKSFIEKLQRIPNRTIQQRLIISLDALESDDPVLKKLFLDIACFFVGWEIQEVVKIMETYYSYAGYKIDILKKRCLLRINHGGKLEMHDLLQDMGREISRNNSPDEPEKHSRLWVSNDICEVLKNQKGTEAIEGIIHHYYEYASNESSTPSFFYEYEKVSYESFTTETFKRMNKLRFLHLEGVHLTGSFEQTFEDLRWFCWTRCPLSCLPSEFHLQKLVILELPKSKIRTIWEPNKVFVKLKSLNMSNSLELTKTPDFTNLPCLETLNFGNCKSLEEVHISIGSLTKLVSLNLCSCLNLRSLHDSICNLTALKSLNISSCAALEALPIEMEKIESLEELYAECLNVSRLPKSMGCLRNLIKLQLSYNDNLEVLPDTICDLRVLEVLSISYCSGLKELPRKLGNIVSLKVFNAEGLNILKLPNSIGRLGKLVKLILSCNENLETLPDTICKLRSLEILDISRCEKLAILPDQLWKVTRLRVLVASGATMLKKLPDIELSQIESSLKELDISMNVLTALPSCIKQLSNLENLNLEYCRHLLSVPDLPPNLKQIRANGCTSMKQLPNLSNLKELKSLNLMDCRSLTEIVGLEELTSIETLHLEGCKSSLLACASTKSLFQIYSGLAKINLLSQDGDSIELIAN